MLINDPRDKDFSKVEIIGIAIQPISAKPPQNHIAILYAEDVHSEPKLLHIDIRGRLINDTPSNSYFWLDLGEFFDEMNKNILVAHVLKVIQSNPQSTFHYGFDTDTKIINPETGEFSKSIGGTGLTCATFVLEIFESCGMPLVKWKSWQKKQPSAVRWQKQMLRTYIAIPGTPKEVIDRQQANIGNRRYLPEEVTVSTQLECPVTRNQTKLHAKKLRDFLVGSIGT